MKRNTLILLMLMWLLAACRSEPVMLPTPTIPPPTAMTVPATPQPQPVATATPMPSPTPIVPMVSVMDRVVGEDGRILVEQVISPEAGWLALLTQPEPGNEGVVLGFTAVAPGLNESVIVTIDPLQASPELTAVLLSDGGEMGVFEFPAADEPMMAETAATSFAIDLEMPLPAVTITDQAVTEAGQVSVANVYALEPGWLLIYADAGGAMGDLLGFVRVEAGSQSNLSIPIQWRQATARLYAVLHQDAGQPNRMDGADIEPPVVVNGSSVAAPFTVTLPLDVFVLDQPMVNGQIVVDRVFVNDPAWLVLYFDDEGLPDRIIGFAPLMPGVNERIVVPVVETAVTSPLHILIHEDTDPGNDFDFPANDLPLRVNGQFQTSVTFATDPGSYFQTQDQVWQLSEDGDVAAIRLPLVVLDRNVWLVIYNDVNGAAADIVGRVALAPGIHRDVQVEIDLVAATNRLHAVLHRDDGDISVFNYPDGVDTPFGGQTNLVQSPFSRIAEPTPQPE